MGQLPRISFSKVLIEDALTGKVRTTRLSDHALRPKYHMMLLAYAEAAQHGMQAGVPRATDAKNKTGCATIPSCQGALYRSLAIVRLVASAGKLTLP